MFKGLNQKGWIFRIEPFFPAHHMTEKEKMVATTISLDGEALAWFQWEDNRRLIHSWMELKTFPPYPRRDLM